MHANFPDAELAVIVRSGFAESRHRGFAVAVDGQGEAVVELGDPSTPFFPRSSLKPFQAIASLRAGAKLEGEHLAIAAASHDGSQAHLDVVTSVLSEANLSEDDLACPPALPSDPAALREATVAGAEPRRLWHNCSGKHSGMLTACRASEWETSGYLDPHHPYQSLVRDVVTELVGPIHATAVDGCGAPVHAVTVMDFARAFARLPWGDPDGVRVAEAMRAHPVLVGGQTADDTRLMQLVPGLVAKRGAEGVLAVSAPGGGGVVVKMSDGSQRATTLVALHLLHALGVDMSAASALGHTAILGGGLPVGRIDPSIGLLSATQGE